MFGAPHEVISGPNRTYHGRARRKKNGCYQVWVERMEDRTLMSAVITGFSQNALPASDDGSSGQVPLGFNINFFGHNLSSLYVNNNGNVTFFEPFSQFTPFGLTKDVNTPILAPFFADVDTRAAGQVTYGTGTVDGHQAFGVTWNNVGYYNNHSDKTDTFQLVLIDRSDTGAGNFDVLFNYDKVQWDTGDASSGSSAVAGFSDGSGNQGTSFMIPGSGQSGAFLDGNTDTGLVANSQGSATDGAFVFNGRGGQIVPGGQATRFVLSAPEQTTAGSPVNVTVTALDIDGNKATGYNGTIQLSDTAGGANLPGSVTLKKGVGSFSATLTQAGGQTVQAVDSKNSALTGSTAIDVNPGDAAKFVLSTPAGTTFTAGNPFTVSVTAKDAFGNVATGYNGTLQFGDSAGGAQLPSGITLTNGTGSFDVTLTSAQAQAITASDSQNSSVSGSTDVTITPAATTHFLVTAPGSVVAGNPFVFTVTAYDDFGNVATGYSGTVQFADPAGQAQLPAPTTLHNGTGSFNATLSAAQSQSLTASDSADSSISGDVLIAVAPAASTHFIVSAPATAVAGSPITYTVTVYDKFGNVDTGYSGTIHFVDSAGGAQLPAATVMSGGSGSFTATLTVAQAQTITASDISNASISGAANVAVSPAGASKFVLTAPASAVAGSAISIGVTALDAFGNVATGYSGTVHFTDSSSGATLPGNATLSAGEGTFNATLTLASGQTIVATDSANGSVTGSAGVAVSPAAASHFAIDAPANATAGSPFSVTITALDPFGNVATGYSGTVELTGSIDGALIPGGVTLANGTGTFNATFATAEPQTLSATDSQNGSIAGSVAISVAPATALRFVVTAPPTAVAGEPVTFSVVALDTFGNVAAGYTGSLRFNSSDTDALLPEGVTLNGGIGRFTATFFRAGEQSLLGDDSVTPGISGDTSVSVAPAAAKLFAIATPAEVTAGNPFTYTVTALDAFGNVATAYAGAVHFGSDTATELPGDTGLTDGVGTFTAIAFHSGPLTLSASDGAVTGNASVSVDPAAATHFLVVAPGGATAGTPVTVKVTALDPYNNVDTNYNGPVHFSSTDSSAGLPADSSLSGGVGSFSATFLASGKQALIAGNSVLASISGTTSIAVAPAPASQFVLSTPPTATAGSPVIFVVTARDPFGNTATGYDGTINFSSADPRANLPEGVTLTNGVGSFGAVFAQAGPQTLVAADSANGAVTGSAAISVDPAVAARFVVDVPASATAGSPISVTITALDAFGNVATSYAGTLTFTTSDPGAVLPGPATLTNGVGSFIATLATTGAQTLSVGDGAVSGTSNSVGVAASSNVHFVLEAPAVETAGSNLDFTVEALDPFGNLATNFTDPVTFGTTDASGQFSANQVALTNGVGQFSAVMTTAGPQALIVASDGTSTAVGVLVTPAPANHFALAVPSAVNAGSAFGVIVTALDPFNNVDTNFQGTVELRSSDALGLFDTNYTFTGADAGRHAFGGLILESPGPQRIAVDEAGAPNVFGAAGIGVANPGPSNLNLALSNTTLNLGQSLTVSGSFTDPAIGHIHVVTVSWGDSTGPSVFVLPVGVLTFSSSHQFLVPGTAPITVTVSDNTGGATAASTAASVVNVAPAVFAGGDVILTTGSAFLRTGSISVPVNLGLSASVDFGDNTGVQPLTLGANNSFVLSHTYHSEGVYTVTVTANDGHGGHSAAQFIANVLFAGVGAFDIKTVGAGGIATATVSGISTTLAHAGGALGAAMLLVADLPSNVANAAIGVSDDSGVNTAYDMRIIAAGAGDVAVAVFHYKLVGGLVPTLTFLDPATGQVLPIHGSTLVANSFVIDTVNQTITVILDRSSFPALQNLHHTLFAVAVTPASTLTVPPPTAASTSVYNGPTYAGVSAVNTIAALTVTGTTTDLGLIPTSEQLAENSSFVLLNPTVTLSPSQVGPLDEGRILPASATTPPQQDPGIVNPIFQQDRGGVRPANYPEDPGRAPAAPAPLLPPPAGLDLSALDLNDEFLQIVAGDVSEGRLITESMGRWMPERVTPLRDDADNPDSRGKASLAAAATAVFLSLQNFAHNKGLDRSTAPRTRRPRPTPRSLADKN